MKPSEIYALPTRRSEPWFESWSGMERVFDEGGGFNLQNYDVPEGDKEVAGVLRFEEKLFHNEDYERSASYTAITFHGKPIALLLSAGRGQQDHVRVYITDAEGFKAAQDHIDRWKDRPSLGKISGLDEDIPELGELYGCFVWKVGDEVRLIRGENIADDGTLLFDDVLYGQAFNELVRPAYKGKMGCDEEFKRGIAGVRMRELVSQAILRGVPDGVEAFIVNKTAPLSALKDQQVELPAMLPYEGDWVAVAVRSPGATHVIGLSSGAATAGWFSWGNAVKGQHIGGPELFDLLADAYRPAETDAPAPR